MTLRRPRRLVALIVGLAVLAPACADGGASTDAGEALGTATLAAYTADWPRIEVAETTTTTTTAPAPLPALPVPDPIPLNAYQAEPADTVIGHLHIPRLGLDEPLHQGMSLTVINRGPSHWKGTANPGQMGNMVLAGHRVTYSRPFHNLDLVEPGDEMIVGYEDETFTYVATHTEVVTPDALWIADQTHGFTATTFACHPKGSARERIVVFWQLVDDDGVPVPALA